MTDEKEQRYINSLLELTRMLESKGLAEQGAFKLVDSLIAERNHLEDLLEQANHNIKVLLNSK